MRCLLGLRGESDNQMIKMINVHLDLMTMMIILNMSIIIMLKSKLVGIIMNKNKLKVVMIIGIMLFVQQRNT